VLFRDYAVGDLAQHRFEEVIPSREVNKLDENFYVRGDGTRAYYFSKEFLKELFIKQGFVEMECKYINKDVENKKENKQMHRIWLQAKFQKPTNGS